MHVQQLSHEMANLGHHVDVHTLTTEKLAPQHDANRDFNVYRTYLPKPFRHEFPKISKILELLKGYDVIHLHQYHQPLAARIVRNLSDEQFVVFTPHYHGVGKNRFTTFLHKFWRITFGKRLMMRSDRIVAVSVPEQDLLIRDFSNISKKIAVIPNGTAPPSDAEPFETKRPVVLCVGRLERYKNVEVLIRASVDAQWDLVIVGDGPDLERLQALATSLASQTIFLGFIPSAELDRWRATATVSVSASSQESFGLSVADGVAWNHNVVCSDLPAHRFINELSGADMTLLDGFDEIRWRQAIEQALVTPPTKAQLPTWGEVAATTIELYQAQLKTT